MVNELLKPENMDIIYCYDVDNDDFIVVNDNGNYNKIKPKRDK